VHPGGYSPPDRTDSVCSSYEHRLPLHAHSQRCRHRGSPCPLIVRNELKRVDQVRTDHRDPMDAGVLSRLGPGLLFAHLRDGRTRARRGSSQRAPASLSPRKPGPLALDCHMRAAQPESGLPRAWRKRPLRPTRSRDDARRLLGVRTVGAVGDNARAWMARAEAQQPHVCLGPA
jgi:hypothetical protein